MQEGKPWAWIGQIERQNQKSLEDNFVTENSEKFRNRLNMAKIFCTFLFFSLSLFQFFKKKKKTETDSTKSVPNHSSLFFKSRSHPERIRKQTISQIIINQQFQYKV